MAALDIIRPAASGLFFGGRFLTFLGGIYAAVANWRAAAATRSSLLKLSDHELDDIGLARGDIEDIQARINL